MSSYRNLYFLKYKLFLQNVIIYRSKALYITLKSNRPVSTVARLIFIGAVRVRFGSRSGQTGHSVANVSPPPQRFFGAVSPRLYAAEIGPAGSKS